MSKFKEWLSGGKNTDKQEHRTAILFIGVIGIIAIVIGAFNIDTLTGNIVVDNSSKIFETSSENKNIIVFSLENENMSPKADHEAGAKRYNDYYTTVEGYAVVLKDNNNTTLDSISVFHPKFKHMLPKIECNFSADNKLTIKYTVDNIITSEQEINDTYTIQDNKLKKEN